MVTRRNRQFGVFHGWMVGLIAVPVGKCSRSQGGCERRQKGFAAEWSAPEDAEPGDESVWRFSGHRPTILTMRHTIPSSYSRRYEAVREQTRTLSAFLNQWPRRRETALGNWAACERILREMPDLRTLGAAISKDRDSASVGGCGFLDDELPLVSLVERRNGFDWVAPFVADLSRSLDIAVAVDIGGPSVSR